MALGDLVRRRRLELDLSQAAVSKRMLMAGCDVDPSYVSLIERGKIDQPSRDILIGLARALEVSTLTVLEAAGFIPPEEMPDIQDAELARLYARLSPSGRRLVIDVARVVARNEQRVNVR